MTDNYPKIVNNFSYMGVPSRLERHKDVGICTMAHKGLAAKKKKRCKQKTIAANKKVNAANKKVITANKKVNAANKK